MLKHVDPHRQPTTAVALTRSHTHFCFRITRQVACGGYHSAVVTDAGRAFAWGFNRYGQCGNGNKDNTVSEPALVDLSDVPPGRLGEVPQVLAVNAEICAGSLRWCLDLCEVFCSTYC